MNRLPKSIKSRTPKTTNKSWSYNGADSRFTVGEEKSTQLSRKESDISGHVGGYGESIAEGLHLNEFEGMSGSIEVIEPVHIPGYKVRG